MKKIDYESVLDYFSNSNCTLLTLKEDYKNATTKLRYLCECGEESKIIFFNFKNGQRCCKCRSQKISNKVSNTRNKIITYIEDQGYQLLSKNEIIQNTDDIELLCPNGHTYISKWRNFRYSNNRCNQCNLIKRIKYTFDDLISIFKKQGCILLTGKHEYENIKTKLKYICSCGNEHMTILPNFLKGQRCKECRYRKMADANRLDYDCVKNYFSNYECLLMSNSYTGINEKLYFICKCGRESYITFSQFKLSKRCVMCGNEETGNRLRKKWEDILFLFESNGCEVLSQENEYRNSKSYVKYKCICGNIALTQLSPFIEGSRCKSCGEIKRIKTNMERYGVPHTTQVDKFREKMRTSLYLNGTSPCSSQQRYINSVIGGELNFPIKQISLDIAFIDEKNIC